MLDNETTDAGMVPTIAATIEVETKVEVDGGSVTLTLDEDGARITRHGKTGFDTYRLPRAVWIALAEATVESIVEAATEHDAEVDGDIAYDGIAGQLGVCMEYAPTRRPDQIDEDAPEGVDVEDWDRGYAESDDWRRRIDGSATTVRRRDLGVKAEGEDRER